MAMNSRELRTSLTQLQTDLQASMPKDSAELLEKPEVTALTALLQAVSEEYPDHPIVKALAAEPPREPRVREALVVVGQLLSAVPKQGPSIG